MIRQKQRGDPLLLHFSPEIGNQLYHSGATCATMGARILKEVLLHGNTLPRVYENERE